MRGIFISFEGIEGTGKSTHSKLLAEFLKTNGYNVTLTAEPGGTRISLGIRNLLLSIESKGMDPVTELFLYNAARVQHIKELILPALKRGDIVITDRFIDSTVAYQGYGRGIDLKLIYMVDQIATGNFRPDITILLDTDVKTGLRRNREINKNDRLELEDIAFHERVRQGFLAIASKEPNRVKLIDCSESIEIIQQKIIDIVSSFFQNHR